MKYLEVKRESVGSAFELGSDDVRLQYGLSRMWFNPLNVELNPICHLLALLGAHHILHFSSARINVSLWANRYRQHHAKHHSC